MRQVDCDNERLKILLLEALSVFKRANENIINLIVALFHASGEVDAGDIIISQGNPYSWKWEMVMSGLIENGLVKVEQRGYREYLFNGECQTNSFKDVLENLKNKSYNELREITLKMHFETIRNKQKTRHKMSELNDLLNMGRVQTSTT